MDERPTRVYIPPNLSSSGLLGGILDTRRVIEAAVCAGIVLLLNLILKAFLPFTIALIITILIGAPVVIVAIAGVGGEPLSVFLLNVINYQNRRIFVTLKPPMPEAPKAPAEEKKTRKRKNR